MEAKDELGHSGSGEYHPAPLPLTIEDMQPEIVAAAQSFVTSLDKAYVLTWLNREQSYSAARLASFNTVDGVFKGVTDAAAKTGAFIQEKDKGNVLPKISGFLGKMGQAAKNAGDFIGQQIPEEQRSAIRKTYSDVAANVADVVGDVPDLQKAIADEKLRNSTLDLASKSVTATGSLGMEPFPELCVELKKAYDAQMAIIQSDHTDRLKPNNFWRFRL